MPLSLAMIMREAQDLVRVLVFGECLRGGGAHDLHVGARADHLADVCIRDAAAAGAHTGDQQRLHGDAVGARGQLNSAETYASAQNFQTVQDTRAGSFISGASRRLDIGGRPKALHARITLSSTTQPPSAIRMKSTLFSGFPLTSAKPLTRATCTLVASAVPLEMMMVYWPIANA
eukprot:scaffold116613_cov63-Phaeocystis_antarctica.AAC.2